MASYNELNALIDAYINRNGVQAITGQILNGVLKAMVEQLGRGYTIMGAAIPTTDPGTPDGPECYFASETGTYTDFDGVQVVPGELALLCYTPTDGWTKATIYEGFQEVQATIDGNVGTPSVGVSYANGVLSFDFHNMKGNPGADGNDGAPAGFGTIDATVDGNIGTPGVSVQTSGPNTAKNLTFAFTNLKGETGVTSVVATVDNTTGTPACTVSLVGQQLTLAFSGLKGAQGNTGSSVDYPFTIVNNLTTDDATQALSAAQGVVLESEVSQLEAKVTDLDDAVMKEETVVVKSQFTDVGGRYANNGTYTADPNGKRGLVVIPVVPGATYKITTYLSSTIISGAVYTSDDSVVIGQDLTTVLGTEYPGTGTAQTIEQQPLTIPVGTKFIVAQTAGVLQSADISGVYETTTAKASNVYTKSETDALLANKADDSDITTIEGQISNINNKIDALDNAVYGVKWSTTDFNDLGTRILNSIGKTATAGVGNTDGSSDFDSIWPWSGMKRCNIKSNENGAKIVTFEGEIGFALDGSNGDVFVRIPKFKTDHYVKDGYEYITIGEGSVHPAFIEDGKELEEIFVGAFEASGDNTALYSKAGIIPANNMTGGAFLAAAKARGTQYTLYDMRTVDAVWRLMAVEFGCRNSNRIIGYGYADFIQPIDHEYYRAAVAAQASNTITCGNVNGASWARVFNTDFAPGNTITICDGEQANIVARRVITSVTANAGSPLVIQFDGDPIDITTTMFVGNGPAVCNYCESIGSGYKLSWHTGQTNRPVVASSGLAVETTNPCRYRWIENPVGSLWHFLPDVTFNDLQMYVCSSMKDYEFARHTSPYVPVGPVLPLQNSNGNKGDVNSVSTPNYWMTSLLNDIFVKGNSFGKSFDTVHDGTITSQKGYGGYYYLNTGTMCVINGGGFDHLWRCNILTHRAQVSYSTFWYLYGARLMFKNI